MRARRQKGFSVVEVIIAVAILGMVTLAVGSFMRDVFFLNHKTSGDINAVYDLRALLKTVAKELRSASPSSLGAYPIEAAGTSTLIFYADTDGDGLKERIRYFLDINAFKRGSTIPSGSPLTYNLANETTKTLVSNVSVGTTTPIFSYFGSSYAGTESPLAYGDIVSIRLVKVTLPLLPDPIQNPVPITGTTQVSLRNLKDNL